MKKYIAVIIATAAILCTTARTLNIADPTILVDGGRYYLYGTSADSNTGFEVYVSDNLKEWHGPAGVKEGKVLSKGDAFGSWGFWAPQVIKIDSLYYMLYTADEQIAVAHSASPTGPFVNDGTPLPCDTRRIDPFLFTDTDGSHYLYHVKLDGENKICCNTADGQLKECVKAAAGTWEDTANADWRVAEGPTVMHIDDKYHIFYSVNDYRNPDYAVGHAVADNPYGPWIKEDKPLISRHNIGINGTGHGDVFTDADGTMRYVFHAHASDEEVAPRQTLIVALRMLEDGRFEIVPESVIKPQLLP